MNLKKLFRKSKRINVYDIDDTLLICNARIRIYEAVKPICEVGHTLYNGLVRGKLLLALTPQDFNTYHQPGQKFVNLDNRLTYSRLGNVETFEDYNDFDSLEIMQKGQLIKPIYEELVNDYKRIDKVPVAIITARPSARLVYNFFRGLRLPLHPAFIFPINDPALKLTGSTSEKKQECFKQLIDKGYNHFTFYDDDEKNLALADIVCKAVDAIYKPILVTDIHRKHLAPIK